MPLESSGGLKLLEDITLVVYWISRCCITVLVSPAIPFCLGKKFGLVSLWIGHRMYACMLSRTALGIGRALLWLYAEYPRRVLIFSHSAGLELAGKREADDVYIYLLHLQLLRLLTRAHHPCDVRVTNGSRPRLEIDMTWSHAVVGTLLRWTHRHVSSWERQGTIGKVRHSSYSPGQGLSLMPRFLYKNDARSN